MTAILAVNPHEARQLIRKLAPLKLQGIYHYSGLILNKKVALYCTRTQAPALEQIRRFLRLYPFERVLCIGTAAALTGNLSQFDSVLVDEFISPDKKLLLLIKSKSPATIRIVSVRGVISKDQDKAFLAETYQAQLLDQEFYRLASILTEEEFSMLIPVFIKVIDDVAGDERYLIREAQYRNVFTAPLSLKNFFELIYKIIHFGIIDFIKIFIRKRRLQLRLLENIKKRLSAKID